MSSASTATILLVDDSHEDRHTYKSYLQASRDGLYTFLEADDAEEGLRICRQTQLDCIILDFEMPDMSGLEFLERLATDCRHERPPVIMVTGRGSETVAVNALKAGAFDYLVKKNVSAQSVFRATNNALEVAQLNRSLVQETKDRQDAESDLRDSEARYRMLVESVRDYAIMMLDENAKITSWNAGARTLFGYHDDEVLLHHVRCLYPTDALRDQRITHELEEGRLSGSNTANGFLVRKDGTQFWGAGSISPVHDRWGTLCGFSKVVRKAKENTSDIGGLSGNQKDAIDTLARCMGHSRALLDGSAEKFCATKPVDIAMLNYYLEQMQHAIDILRAIQDR